MGKTFKKILCTLLVVVMCLTAAPLDGFVGIEWPEINFDSWFNSKADAASNRGTCGDNLTWVLETPNMNVLIISGSGNMTSYGSYSDVPWYSFRSRITRVVLPDGLTSIGDNAFYYFERLQYITIPDSVETIGNNAFANCSSLVKITIPDSVISIGNGAFYKTSIESITIGDSVKSIGASAFNTCKKLYEVIIGDKVITIGDNAFNYCDNLYSIKIPDSVTNIGNGAFSNCRILRDVTIGNSVTTIGNEAFNNCDNLYSIKIPDSVTSIGTCAFGNCNILRYVTIGNSVTTIGDEAFENCGNIDSIIIPDSVTTIGNSAFSNCDNLRDVTIGNGVKTIGDKAFESCDDLYSLIIPDSVTTIGNRAFYDCISLTSVIIGDNITLISDYSFQRCSSLECVTIGDSVTSIGACAFGDCSNLTSITIPDNVINVGNAAFSRCYNLTNVTIGNSVTVIGNSAFSDCSNLVSVTIPDSVTTIGNSAFYDCIRLTSVTIGNSVTVIGNSAFYNIWNLISLTIPDSVTTIGKSAFEECRITNVYYEGSETEWSKITLGSNNAPLTNATIHYNCVMPDIGEDDDPTAISEKFKFRRDEYVKKMDYSGDIPMMEITETIYLDCNPEFLTSKGYEYDDISFAVADTNILTLDRSALYSSSADKIVMYCSVTPLKSGTTTLTATLPDGTSASCKIISEVIEKTVEDSDDTTIKSEWFEKGAYSGYNHELAQFCADIVNKGYSYNIDTVRSNLSDYGLSVKNIYSFAQGINMASERDEVNYFIADKTLKINGVDKTLIVVGCIGSYKKQWYSNFDPMSIESVKDYADLSEKSNTHHGFANARDYVFRNLVAYIDFNNIDKSNSIILLTGHSRGAATVNLLGAKLIDISSEFGISMNDIYTYGFATPNTTTNNIFPSKYNSIKNIVNPEDFVTKVLPTSWGYKRYGVTYKLPSATNDKDYDDYLSRLKKVNTTYEPYEDGEEIVFTLLENMSNRLSNVEDYYLKRDVYDGETTFDYFKKCICPYVAEEKDWKFYTNIADTLVKFGTFQKQLTSFFLNHQKKRPDFENSHSMNTYYTFLKTMTSDEVTKFRSSYSGTVNCPVDVEIYDKETGELVGRIVDNVVDEEIEAKDNSIVMDVDGDSKNFWLPSNGDYEIKLIGNDKGTMDYTMSEIDSDTGEVKRVNFFDVAITDGLIMTADVESEEFVIEEHKLTYQNGKTLTPTEVLDEDEIPVYDIEVTATEGGVATESHTAKSGAYVSLEAKAEEGWKFVGWYENGKLVSDDTEYAFVAKSDRKLEARFDKSTSSDENYQVGDIIQFGSYPQSKVTDSATISALNAKAPAWSDWTSYVYYSGTGSYGTMEQGDWMRYTDILYNGNKYRGVKFTQYRPDWTCRTSSSNYIRQDDNGYYVNNTYWFKYEPIYWQILDINTGLVVSKTIVDSQPYSNTYYTERKGDYGHIGYNDYYHTNYANDYETSSIRKWLNEDFYNIAFTDNERININISTLDNRSSHFSTEEFNSNETNDKIFLLSYYEAQNKDLGFISSEYRCAQGSDYALCQGLKTYGNDKNSCWFLRSPGGVSYDCTYITENGYVGEISSPYSTCYGIRPAARLEDLSKASKHEHSYVRTVVYPTCEQDGYTQYQCKCGAKYSDNFTSAKDHTYGEYRSDNNATCAANGTKTAKCNNCSKTDTKEELGTRKEHDFYYEIRYEATCTEEGTRIQKCHNCNWMIYEHYLDDHSFGNKDSKCKDCGYDRTKGCSCKCHKGGITGFFFKIGLFFQKIFKKNKVCKCGVYHY